MTAEVIDTRGSGSAAQPELPLWRRVLTRDEVRELQRMRDARSWMSLALNWGIVFGAFALVAVWPNPLTIVLALFLIGGRQLGFAVFMHDASHYALFSDRKVNDWVGNWLAAYPIWGDLHPYRPYHVQHHAHTWTERDPDLGLATPFPITRDSFWRKVWRDLSGQTGWKRALFTLKRDLGASQGKVRRRDGAGWRRLKGVVITNAVLFGILAGAGHPLLYLLWVVAWLTTYSLIMRIRAIAEHSMVPDASNPMQNTRTTLASWWERLFIAPNRVNFHLEHHLLMRVPHYNLPRMHAMLRDRGALDDALVAKGYWDVLREASGRQAA
jgi:fatty acid desaturase